MSKLKTSKNYQYQIDNFNKVQRPDHLRHFNNYNEPTTHSWATRDLQIGQKNYQKVVVNRFVSVPSSQPWG